MSVAAFIEFCRDNDVDPMGENAQHLWSQHLDELAVQRRLNLDDVDELIVKITSDRKSTEGWGTFGEGYSAEMLQRLENALVGMSARLGARTIETKTGPVDVVPAPLWMDTEDGMEGRHVYWPDGAPLMITRSNPLYLNAHDIVEHSK